jgi:soluble lytic murein transglycosylase-like protein
MAAIVLAANAGGLAAQGLPVSGQALATSNQLFARYDESLAKVADALLINTPLTTTEPRTEATTVSPATLDYRTTNPWGGVGNHATVGARLDLLRPVVESILQRHGISSDLGAAVILVESGGRTDALSAKGARGIWQLMPGTARRYGLRVDAFTDDRLDLLKSTDAAAQYLHDLYVQFGDWRLALAAYNAGEGHVASAIVEAHSQDFDQLISLRMLPHETRDYVPRVLANAYQTWQQPAIGHIQQPISSITVFAVSSR